ncbi:MAG: hypothetical protein ACOC22_00165 [bacterium]
MLRKSSPNEMRDLLGKMRGTFINFNKVNESSRMYKEMTMRDMLKITRNLNENEEEKDYSNKATSKDISFIEESIRNAFENTGLNVVFKFPENNEPHQLYVDEVFVYWGATINNVLMFTYTINVNDDADSGVKFKYVEESSVLEDSEEYENIVSKIEEFYDTTFFPYFRELMKQ